MARAWRVAEEVSVPDALLEAVGGSPLLARLLAQRGISDPQQARGYLDPAHYRPASPWELPDMERLAARLHQALERGERVRIWGDFDPDGQTATAVLWEALTWLGARVDYQLPLRDEGHGLHQRVVDEALRDGVAVLITCDSGSTDVDVVADGAVRGLTVLITDHHDLPANPPPAYALVNAKALPPEHPLRELTGVGVAYVVAQALLEGRGAEDLLERMLDMVAIGLVADVARQVRDVRYLIQRGLRRLQVTDRPGLRAMIAVAGLDAARLTERDLSQTLGPRLNAAGRLADASLAVELLITEDAARAAAIARELEAMNSARQERTRRVEERVREQLAREPWRLERPALVVEGSDWLPGVMGLVAGRLAAEYHRPAILILHREGEESIGSSRSVEGTDIHAAIASQQEYLVREGGHPMAAGFSILPQNVPAFVQGVWDWLERQGPPPEVPPVEVEAVVAWEEVDLELARQVERLAPFGAGNPPPVLAVLDGTLAPVQSACLDCGPQTYMQVVGPGGRQLRFRLPGVETLPRVGERIDLAFTVRRSWSAGLERMDLTLVDWRPAAR